MPPESRQARSLPVLGLIIGLSLLVRFPFFFQAVVDWDESTFILIGQSMVDGHLPYVHLWDLKPPLLFTFFAGVIALFGDSLIGVRFAGALCVAASAWLVYLIAVRWTSGVAATAAAVLCVVVSSRIESGQATLSEHVMLPALLGAVYVWLRAPGTLRAAAGAGALMAVATLVRSNIALSVIAFGVLICAAAVRQRASVVRIGFAYAAGGLGVLLLVCLPYAVTGHLTLLWKTVVVAAAIRAGTSTDGDSGLAALGAWVLRGGGGGPGFWGVLWAGTWLWICAIAGLAVLLRRRAAGRLDRGAGLVAGVAVAVAASITISGDVYAHYLIQIVPFAAIFSAAAFAHLTGKARGVAWVLAVVLSVIAMRPVVGEYRRLVIRTWHGAAVTDGPAVAITGYLREHNPAGQPVLLLIDHLAYWWLRSEPPNGILTHPSVLERESVLRVLGTTAREQLELAFAQAPAFVVFRPGDWFLGGEVGEVLALRLAADYDFVQQIDERHIYRRRHTRSSG